MTGFEVVGVVLAVIPLLLSGLSEYRNGLGVASNMVKYERTIETLILRFRVLSSCYLHSWERLIGPLMLEPTQYEALVDDPGGDAWRSKELGQQVQERLGADFSTYVDVARVLHARLIKFATKLALDPNNGLKPKWLTDAAQTGVRQRFFRKSNQTWRGLKIGIENGNLETALQQIEADLSRLGQLLDANEREAPIRQERKRKGSAKVWRGIRDAAKSMYEAFATHWSCPQGQHRHVAFLKLESRKATDQAAALRFGLIMSLQDLQGPSLLWQDVEIEPQLALPTSTLVTTPKPPPSPPGFKVSFMPMATPSVTITQVTSASKGQTPPGLKIHSLCQWQQCLPALQNNSFGFFEHQAWHHHIFKGSTTQSRPSNLNVLSLNDCMAGTGSTNASTIFTRGLNTKEKYNVATTLASSVLQLADTPWLSGNMYELQDIYFVDMKQRALTAASAYLQRSFPPRPANQAHNKPVRSFIDNALVFALGVVLIELAYGQPLETFKTSTDRDPHGNDYPHTDYQVALRLVKQLTSMEGEKYAAAAWRCVKCNFEAMEQSMDNTEFQEQFYTGVVVPLQELKDALG